MPKTKGKPRERTSLMLSREDYKLLNEVREANDWSVAEATRHAVHALFALDAHLAGRAEQQDRDVQRMVNRVRRDVDSALLVQAKPMAKVTTESGECGVRVGDLTFLEEDDRLFARREIGGQVEVYEVNDEGRLVLRYPTGLAPGDVILSMN